MQVLINVGILTGYLIAIPYGFKFDAFVINGVTIDWWRVMLALAIVPAIAQVGGMNLPEGAVVFSFHAQQPLFHCNADVVLWSADQFL